jgi:biofilm PGA synthesis N-glycosyltransferase PgaC
MVFLDQGGVEQANYGLYWRYEVWIRRNLSLLDSLLTATGCVYVMRRELLVPLPPDILVDDFYLPIAAVLQGYRLVFDGGAIAYEYVTPLETDLRRKARTLAGLYQMARAYAALMLPFRRMGCTSSRTSSPASCCRSRCS